MDKIDIFTAFCGFFAAFFFFMEKYQTNESNPIRQSIEEKWYQLEIDKWLELPYKGLSLFLKLKQEVSFYNDLIILTPVLNPTKLGLFFSISRQITSFVLFPLFIILSDTYPSFFGNFDRNHIWTILLLFGLRIIAPIFINLFSSLRYNAEAINLTLLLGIFSNLYYVFFISYILVNAYRNSVIILTFSSMIIAFKVLAIFLLLIVALFFFYYLLVIVTITKSTIAQVFYFDKFSTTRNIFNFLYDLPSIFKPWGVAPISIVLSFVGASMGFFLLAGSQSYPSLQLLTSNFIFDFCTVAATFFIVERILYERYNLIFNVLLLIVDVVLSFIFSFGSLYFGLLYSKDQLSIEKCLDYTVGIGYLNYNNLESFYFFFIHTTLMPTLLYLFIIIFLFLGKGTLSLSKYLFVPKESITRPYSLTRAFFLLLIALGILIRTISKL